MIKKKKNIQFFSFWLCCTQVHLGEVKWSLVSTVYRTRIAHRLLSLNAIFRLSLRYNHPQWPQRYLCGSIHSNLTTILRRLHASGVLETLFFFLRERETFLLYGFTIYQYQFERIATIIILSISFNVWVAGQCHTSLDSRPGGHSEPLKHIT